MTMERTFHADPVVIEKYEGRMRSEILQIVLYSLLVIVSIAFAGTIGIIFSLLIGFASFSLLIVSIILMVLANGKVKRYQSSVLTLSETGVSGTYFPTSGAPAGVPFSVDYSEIISVSDMPGEGLNLMITTGTGLYQCLAIQSAQHIASLIRTAVSEQKSVEVSAQAVVRGQNPYQTAPITPTPQPSQTSQIVLTNQAVQNGQAAHTPNQSVFCHFCGAKIPADSVFCPKCGARLQD